MLGHHMNGGTIVAVMPAVHSEHYVVLHVAGRDTHDRYATGLVHYSQLPKPEEWWTGHYFHRLEDAVADFYDRGDTDVTHTAALVAMTYELFVLDMKEESS